MSDTFSIYRPPHRAFDIKKVSKNAQESVKDKKTDDEFYSICMKTKSYIYEIYDAKVEAKARNEIQEDYVNIFHEALRGAPEAVSIIKKHIEHFVVENGLTDTKFPSYYRSLVDGIFEEEFGWGPLSAFKHQHDLESAQVIGTDISFKRNWGWETQTFSFRSIEKVFELCDRFSNMHSNTTLNEFAKPELETSTVDGIRVSIMIPERMFREPVITLRRKVLQRPTLKDLVTYRTIPMEAVELLEILAKFQVNSVISGPPGTGKSTLQIALLNAILYETTQGKKVPERRKTVFAEPNPEFDIREIFPHSNILHMVGRGKEFEDIISASILRHDISRVVLGEIREHEVGLYRRASLQGLKQVMGTLHDLDPINIPEIMTNLYMQYYQNGLNPDVVYKSFARNLHFSISMDEFLMKREGEEVLEKKVTSIQLYGVEERNLKLYTIMQYDPVHDLWCFDDKIPQSFGRLVVNHHVEEYQRFINLLKELSSKFPLKEAGVFQ